MTHKPQLDDTPQKKEMEWGKEKKKTRKRILMFLHLEMSVKKKEEVLKKRISLF